MRQGTRASARPSTRPTPAKVGPQAVRLSAALQALAHGLPNPWDESTDYFHGFTAAMPVNTKLDADSFRQALGIGARFQIDLSPVDSVLKALGDAVGDWSEDIAGGFRQLGKVMHATLTERTRAFARGNGVVRVRVWVFGRTSDGTLVGLRSISTET
jgi:Nuclease A inhibitor-like protein